MIGEYEGILLRWLEINYEVVFGQQKRILNFDDNLKNCFYL